MRKWRKVEDLPVVRREAAKGSSLAEREPLRVIPVEVEVVEVKRKRKGSPISILNFLKFWGTIFWAIAGFWLAMALVARLLGF